MIVVTPQCLVVIDLIVMGFMTVLMDKMSKTAVSICFMSNVWLHEISNFCHNFEKYYVKVVFITHI